jgi:hypothetical protein
MAQRSATTFYSCIRCFDRRQDLKNLLETAVVKFAG